VTLARAAAAVAALVLLVGCAPTHVRTDDGRFVLLSTSTGTAFPDALIAGTLVWSLDGCLSVETPDGSYLLQMPEGTTVRGDDVVLDDDSVVHVGDEVSWGGSYGKPGYSDAGELIGGAADLPVGCVTDEIAVVNSFRFYDHGS
jgi:hypothetical protein